MNARPWIISFWTIMTAFMIIVCIFTWLIVMNYRQKHHTIIAKQCLQYIVQEYLKKSFKRTIHLLHKESLKGNNMDLFVQKYSISLCENLLKFPRNHQIIEQMMTEISKPDLDEFDIFVLPDVLILHLSDEYYYDLLRSCFLEYKIENSNGTGINALSKQMLQKAFRPKSSVSEKKGLEVEQYQEKNPESDVEIVNNELIESRDQSVL